MKILILEDEKFILHSIAKNLTQEGYQVITSENYKNAIEIIKSKELDLIITDLMLPFTGGLDVVEFVKNDPLRSHIPVIVVSGMDQEILSATKKLADAYLAKPFSIDELKALVKKFLPQSQPEI